jgi:thiol reductant ABC exporter CydC subunit
MTRHGNHGRAAGESAPLGRTLAVTCPTFWRLLLATLLGAGAIAADIGLLGTAAWLISKASLRPNESHLAVAIVAVQFFGLTRGLFRYEERLVGHDAAFRLLADLRVKVYERLEALAPAGLPGFRRGDLLARMVQDVDSMQDLVIRVIPPFGMAILVGSLTVALMWWMLPAAGFILAVALLIAGTVVPRLTGYLARRKEARFAGLRGDLSASVLDLTEGAAELIAFGASGSQVGLVQAQDAELTAIASASAGTEGIGLAMTTLLAGLACWGCLLVGIPAVASGRLDGTELAVITLIPLAAFELVVGLPGATQALERVRQAAGRVFEVIDAPIVVSDPEAPSDLPHGPYDLQALSVWASYPDAESPALKGVDLSLPTGRRVAVIGPSGAGKSTLAAVLLRFLPVESGSVSLNGMSLDHLSGDTVRTVLGLVGQNPYLFDATVAENLRIGNRNATDNELFEVLDRVGLAGWLDTLPQGLASEVGRHGGRLSGGQRQRIALARALLADFPMLVLDEPTEHLEPAAADALSAQLLDVTEKRALVLITHRLAGLESVDEILVVDAGRVVERGSHATLLDQGGVYARLWCEEMSTSFHGIGDAECGVLAQHLQPTASTPNRDHIHRSAGR